MAHALRAAVLVTGTEIMLGRIQDRNSAFLARALDDLGARVERLVAVDDGETQIVQALRELLDAGVELVVVSGGLGPTHDDRTVEAVARATGRELVVDARILDLIDGKTAVAARAQGLDARLFAEGNRKQALVPRGAVPLDPVGTAPGLVVPHGEARIVVLPGPPPELQQMWADAVAHPLLADRLVAGERPASRTLRVFGVPESAVAAAFAADGGDSAGTETTICASRMEIEVVIRPGRAGGDAVTRAADALRARLGRGVYAEGAATLEEHLLGRLRERGLTVATAESCTAGLVAARMANVPGSSDVLVGGVVAYANRVKQDMLDVPAALLTEHGAVSAPVARAMAEGARRALGADVAVSVTGIAGPGGGSEAKPVGLVHLYAAGPDGGRALERRLPPIRETVREGSATAALHLVRLLLEDGPDRR